MEDWKKTLHKGKKDYASRQLNLFQLLLLYLSSNWQVVTFYYISYGFSSFCPRYPRRRSVLLSTQLPYYEWYIGNLYYTLNTHTLNLSSLEKVHYQCTCGQQHQSRRWGDWGSQSARVFGAGSQAFNWIVIIVTKPFLVALWADINQFCCRIFE